MTINPLPAEANRARGASATQASGASFNRRMVLDVIRREGRASRLRIGECIGLSPQAVANITQDLEALGLIVSERETGRRSRGQPPIAFALDRQGGDAIGFSLEPERVSGALVNLVGDVLARAELRCDTADPARVLKVMAEQTRALTATARDPARVWGIGVALPGPFDVPGMSLTGPTAFGGWRDLALLRDLERAAEIPVFHATDSVAGALGELLFGVATRLSDYFYLHLGVGLGGVLVSGRTAYLGAAGNATEIGHTPAVAHGRACYCGSHGCLERYLSLHALSEHLHGQAAPELSAAELAALLDADDPALAEWCHTAASHLRGALCMIENLYDPQAVVIGGSAPRRLVERLLALAMPLRPSVRRAAPVRVLTSEREDDSALLGAAVLPIHALLSPRSAGAPVALARHPAHRALHAA